MKFSKANKFRRALEHGQTHGEVLEVDPNEEWFVVLLDQKVAELPENRAAMLTLYLKKKSALIARAKLVYDDEKQNLLIGDIESDVENNGHGSILLRNIITLAEKLGARTITGNLTSADKDHFDMLRHFYGKQGFKVKIAGDSGSIIYQVK